MSATQEGNRRSHATLKKKLGPAGYKQHMASIGAQGGKAKVPKGLSFTRKKAPFAGDVHDRGTKVEAIDVQPEE